MPTEFSLLAGLCGLSIREAADWLEIRPDTAKSWSSGKRNAPAKVLNDLRAMATKIDASAAQAIDLIRESGAEEIEIGYCADDHEAQSLGFPCIGAHSAMIARVLAAIDDQTIILVPRGSTTGTAAAAAAHDK